MSPPFPSLPGAVSKWAVRGSDLRACLRLAPPPDSSQTVCLLLLGLSPGVPPGPSPTQHGRLPIDRATPGGGGPVGPLLRGQVSVTWALGELKAQVETLRLPWAFHRSGRWSPC